MTTLDLHVVFDKSFICLVWVVKINIKLDSESDELLMSHQTSEVGNIFLVSCSIVTSSKVCVTLDVYIFCPIDIVGK